MAEEYRELAIQKVVELLQEVIGQSSSVKR